MQRGGKIALFGVIAVGTAFAVKKLSSLMTISDSVSFSTTFINVHSLDKKGCSIKVGLKIYNPTKETIQLQLNAVRLNYKGKILAQSEPEASPTVISPNSAITKSIVILATYTDILTSDLLTDFIAGSKEKIQQKILSNASLSILLTVNGVSTTVNQPLSGVDGLALSAGPREIKDGTRYNKYFKSGNTRKRITSDGEVNDVVNICIRIVKDHHQEAADIAQILKGETVYDTAANTFNFAYSYLQYSKDKPGVEELRTPARSWYDGQIRHYQQGIRTAGIDCDDFSIFCASVLHCLNIPFKFRITKYNGRSYYQHIYIYIPASENNPEIIIDPVLDRFDYEKPYSAQKDNFNMSALYQVEGLAGMPIEMLGNANDTTQAITNADLLTGRSLMAGLEGLGDPGDISNQLLQNIMNTRQAIAANPSAMQPYTNDVVSLVRMLDDAIRYWYTPQRDTVLKHLESVEKQLEQAGVFKPVVSMGSDGEPVYEIGGFFSKIGKAVKGAVKKVGSGVKAVAKGATNLTKFVAKKAAPLVNAALPIAAGLIPGGGVATGLISKVTGGGSSGGGGLVSKITSKVASSNVGSKVLSSNLMTNTMKLASNPMVSNGMKMASAVRVVSANPQYPSTPSYVVPTTSNITQLVNQVKPSAVTPKPVVSIPAPSPVPTPEVETPEVVAPKPVSVPVSNLTQHTWNKPASFSPQSSNQEANEAAPTPSMATPMMANSLTNNSTSYAMADQTSTGEQKPGFLKKNGKVLLIAGGALLVGTAAFLLLRPKKQPAALPSASPSQPRALAGIGTAKKRKKKTKTSPTPKKTKVKAMAKTKASAKAKQKTLEKSKKRGKTANTRRRVNRVTLH